MIIKFFESSIDFGALDYMTLGSDCNFGWSDLNLHRPQRLHGPDLVAFINKDRTAIIVGLIMVYTVLKTYPRAFSYIY